MPQFSHSPWVPPPHTRWQYRLPYHTPGITQSALQRHHPETTFWELHVCSLSSYMLIYLSHPIDANSLGLSHTAPDNFFFHFSATPSGCEDHCALQVLEVPPPRLRLLAPVESSPHGKQILGHSNPSSITNLNQYVHYPLRRAMSVPSVPDSNQSWVS